MWNDKCNALGGVVMCDHAHGINEYPFEYETSDGYRFKCPRSDFREPIEITGMPCNIKEEHNLHALLTAVAEMISYHRNAIHQKLNGFSGYDCLKWKDVVFESKGDWHFERSSGYPGFRCETCGDWVYEYKDKVCSCDD